MTSDEKLDNWSAAFDRLVSARKHYIEYIGKPGEKLAYHDYKKALEDYNEASGQLDDL